MSHTCRAGREHANHQQTERHIIFTILSQLRHHHEQRGYALTMSHNSESSWSLRVGRESSACVSVPCAVKSRSSLDIKNLLRKGAGRIHAHPPQAFLSKCFHLEVWNIDRHPKQAFRSK